MPITQQQYFDAIGRAGLTMGDNVLACVNSEKKGCSPDWSVAACLLKTIKAAQVFFNMGDYSSSDSIYFYNQVTNIAGSNYTTSVINPNAQQTNITVIVNQTGTTVNENRIYFTNQTSPGLANYLSLYYPVYGNSPGLSLWTFSGNDGSGNPIYNEDKGVSPTINTDANGNIISITWDYPIATTGYIQIIGVQPS